MHNTDSVAMQIHHHSNSCFYSWLVAMYIHHHSNSCCVSDSAVDVLEFVGLRSGDLSSLDAMVATGPDGLLDAFFLERELNTSTFGPEWEQIADNFSTQFGFHVVFNASDYEGSIITITDGSGLIFDVSLGMSENSTDDVLAVTLPGLSTLSITIPASANLRDPSSFQSLGVRLNHYQLLVIVDCDVVNFVNLEDPSLPLPVADGDVRVFGGETIVSVRIPSHVLLGGCLVR